ncbi:MAG: mannose-1-phosphate guanylyltransferase [Candidatus Latescibacterota bacterium]
MTTAASTTGTWINPHTYAVILAGGVGNRFLPYSTPEKPKQFLNITDENRTMIQMTFDRITGLIPADRVFVSTNDRYVDLVREQLPTVPTKNIIGEPQKKNTAPAIGLLNQLIYLRDHKAVTFFLPADHYIANTAATLGVYARAADVAAASSALITFGIVPTFPSPDYGYIRRAMNRHESGAFDVKKFVEKPDIPTAQEYIATGEYFWNGGMFVWRNQTLIADIKMHMSEMSAQLLTLKLDGTGAVPRAWLEQFFEDATGTSIDYGVMEPASLVGSVMTFPFDAGWSDVGTWKGLVDLEQRFGIVLPGVVQEHLSQQVPE